MSRGFFSLHKEDTASFAKRSFSTKKAAFRSAIEDHAGKGKPVLIGGGETENYSILGEPGHAVIEELMQQVGAGIVTSYYVYCHKEQKKLKGSSTTSEPKAKQIAAQHFVDTGGAHGGHFASVVNVVTKG